jgi:hypothetical protein
MPDPKPRQIFLDTGRVVVEAPKLMTDGEPATVPEEFAKAVRSSQKPDLSTPRPPPPRPLRPTRSKSKWFKR